MASGLLSLKWNHHRSTFLHVLANIRQKESYCDVTLACAGKFYSAHKLVLSTCSEYFEEMFERTDCKHPVIVLKDIGADELEALLSYMYDGEVNVLQENLSSLIKAAECLKIKGLAVADHDPSEQPIKDIKSASGGGGGSSSSKDGAVNRSHSNNSGYHHPSDNSSSNSSSRQFRNSTSSSMGGGLKRPNKVDDSQPIKRRRPAATVDASSPARRPSDKSKDPSSKSPSKEGGAADDAAAAAASGDEATNNSVDGVAGDDHASSDGHDDARSFAQGLSEETGVKAEPVEIIDSDDLNYEGGAGGGASDAEFTEEKFAGGAADGGDPNSLWGAGDAADLFSQPSTSFGDGGGSNSGGTTNDTAGGGKAGGSSSGPVSGRSRHPQDLPQYSKADEDDSVKQELPDLAEYPSHHIFGATSDDTLDDDEVEVLENIRNFEWSSTSFTDAQTGDAMSRGREFLPTAPTFSNNYGLSGMAHVPFGSRGSVTISSSGARGGRVGTNATPGMKFTQNLGKPISEGLSSQYIPNSHPTKSTSSMSSLRHPLPGKLHYCTFCPYKTNKTTNLVVHLRTHTNEKPYACPMCSYRCTQPSNLKKHVARHSQGADTGMLGAPPLSAESMHDRLIQNILSETNALRTTTSTAGNVGVTLRENLGLDTASVDVPTRQHSTFGSNRGLSLPSSFGGEVRQNLEELPMSLKNDGGRDDQFSKLQKSEDDSSVHELNTSRDTSLM